MRSATFLGDIGYGVIVSLIVTAILAVLAFIKRHVIRDRFRNLLEGWRYRRAAPAYVQLMLTYMTHLRDGAMEAVWRAETPDEVREGIRRQILEPIRAFLPTVPGEEVKVVWFRPTEDNTHLQMYEQVGHTPEGQAAMRLPIGSGIAGQAYTNQEYAYSADVENDDRFQAVEKGKARGSLACAPIVRRGEVTGVLSVLSTCKHAFWVSERRYFEALAAAIAAAETREESGETADSAK